MLTSPEKNLKLRYIFIIILYLIGMESFFAQANLPITTSALYRDSLPLGFNSFGLGNDYNNPCGSALRFNDSSDYLRLFFSGTPTSLSYTLRSNNLGSNSNWEGVFTIEESVNGTIWNVLRTINSNSTSISSASSGTNFTDIPSPNSRYFRWTFTSQNIGNIGLCGIVVSNSTNTCANSTLYPTSPINGPTSNSPILISSIQWQNEYNQILINTIGNYVSSYSGGGYITIRSTSYNGTLVASGNSPLSWTANTVGNYYVHYNTNSSCGTASNNNNSSIQCTSCPTLLTPSNDTCNNATNLNCGTVNLPETTVGTITETAPGGGGNASSYGVWYTFLGNGQSTTISSTGTNGFDQEMTILSGSCSSLSLITSLDVGFSNGTETYTFTTILNTRYYIYIGHWDSTSTTTGTFTVSRTGVTPATPATITGASTVCANATGISYSVTNVPELIYNWTIPSGWTQTSGGTTNSIIVTAGNTSGTISVSVSNGCGTSTYQTKAISIFAALNAGAHNTTPLNQCIGFNPSALTLTTIPSGGNGNYTYQWQLNTVDVLNATSNFYDPNPILIAGVYSYRCKVTDGCGTSVFTSPKVITIVADPNEPSCLKSPNLATVCAGTTLTMENNSCIYGSQSGLSCPLEYCYSLDGTNWSTPTNTIPAFSANGTINLIRVRVSNCNTCNASTWKIYSWNIYPTPLTTNINHN
jgi:hypothetical protein